jgi:hypothetical protein
MKRVSIFVLSVVLLHGGVAWALESCLHRDNRSQYEALEHQIDARDLSSQDNTTDPSVPIFHCTSSNEQVGPGVRVASAQLAPSSKGVPLQASLHLDVVEPASGNNLWLEALFKKIVTFSLPIDLARHLFLSVLQI